MLFDNEKCTIYKNIYTLSLYFVFVFAQRSNWIFKKSIKCLVAAVSRNDVAAVSRNEYCHDNIIV